MDDRKFECLQCGKKLLTKSDSCTIKINLEPIKKVTNLKLLGVTISSNLTWTQHASEMTKKIECNIRAMKLFCGRVWGITPYQLLQLPHGLIESKINFALPIVTTATFSLLESLEKTRAKSLRVVFGANNLASLDTLLAEANLKPLDIQASLLRCMHILRMQTARLKNNTILDHPESTDCEYKRLILQHSLTLEDPNGENKRDMIKKYYNEKHDEHWLAMGAGKTLSIFKPNVSKVMKYKGLKRFEQCRLHRIRMGCARTGDVLFRMKRQPSPLCEVCNVNDSPEHMVKACIKYTSQRLQLKLQLRRHGINESLNLKDLLTFPAYHLLNEFLSKSYIII